MNRNPKYYVKRVRHWLNSNQPSEVRKQLITNACNKVLLLQGRKSGVAVLSQEYLKELRELGINITSVKFKKVRQEAIIIYQ